MSSQSIIQVIESSQVGEARRIAVRIANAAGMGEVEQGKVAIIATEMANNLCRHATGGHFFVQVVQSDSGDSVEMIAMDLGPGMADVERCLRDGYSTGGTSGTGLGAIKRMSSEFDLYSTPARGTVLLARVAAENSRLAPKPTFVVGAITCPMPGETVCGDSWSSSQSPNELRLIVSDGLGHGPLAREAAVAADQAFQSNSTAEPKNLIDASHRALSGTRGAAVAAALIDLRTRRLKYSGVGNIAGFLLTADGSKGLASHNGIVGVKMHKVQQFEHDCPSDGLLIMHSDGLRSRWTLNDHPGLVTRHPAVIAGVLYRDYCRGRDDVTVVVVRFGVQKV